jgi:hypothetical protein
MRHLDQEAVNRIPIPENRIPESRLPLVTRHCL